MDEADQAQRVGEQFASEHYGVAPSAVRLEDRNPTELLPGIEERDRAITYAWTALVTLSNEAAVRITIMRGPRGWEAVEVEKIKR